MSGSVFHVVVRQFQGLVTGRRPQSHLCFYCGDKSACKRPVESEECSDSTSAGDVTASVVTEYKNQRSDKIMETMTDGQGRGEAEGKERLHEEAGVSMLPLLAGVASCAASCLMIDANRRRNTATQRFNEYVRRMLQRKRPVGLKQDQHFKGEIDSFVSNEPHVCSVHTLLLLWYHRRYTGEQVLDSRHCSTWHHDEKRTGRTDGLLQEHKAGSLSPQYRT
ncbi:hypothetical protein F2P81_020701 [Scophthalmus maximus]|uniref:Uncharacterized protein n=1 Tax=Scophthalmus maximus TaxID=52904 RepID=A0A6A4S8Q6_SCOMX|nr:hypothetical protein F2P81_020701 [Scophthalmus maximus]